MKKLPLLLATSFLSLGFSQTAISEDSSSLAISAGAFDVSQESTAELGLEYRFAPVDSFYDIIPAIGIAANSDGGYWAHAGIRYDIHISDNWVLTPNFAVVGYEKGGGKDLGHDVELRSGLEFAYKINASSHFGLAIYHLSNAGIDDKNPGQESVILSYSFSPDF